MRHNIKSEIKNSMDAIHFSRETKAVMAQTLMAQMEEQNMYHKKRNSRKLLLVALAAAMLLATLTGAAVFTRWSKTAQAKYDPSQDVKEQAEKSGLSVMLENEAGSNEILSATDQGITVTAVQSIVDQYGAQLTFRIEGFDLPEGRNPSAWPVITIDGSQNFYAMQTGAFFDGTTVNSGNEWVYTSDGKPVAYDESGSAILDYVADDGSLEYTHHISFDDNSGRYLGKEIVVSFHSFGVQTPQAGDPETLVEGNWELKWTLSGAETRITIAPNTEIGDSGVTLLKAEIGQLSLRTVYQLETYWDGCDTLEQLPQQVCGVRMKDGTENLCIPSSEGYQSLTELTYCVESSMCDTILDLSQVESLMFHKGWEADENGELTVETFYYIPIA